MSKRGWIIVSIAAAAAGVIGTAAGVTAYVHRARRSASTTAREAFDPYYTLVQYLIGLDQSERNRDGV